MTQTKPPWGPPRPTAFEGVMMRSRLEAAFAQWAASNGLGPEYEPMAFAGADGQYLPDFLLRCVHVEGEPIGDILDGALWVEVKPVLPTGDDLVALLDRMELVRESIPDAVLAVVYKDPTPGMLAQRPRQSWRQAVWTRGRYPYNIGVAFPHPPVNCPWPDGYWKAPEP